MRTVLAISCVIIANLAFGQTCTIVSNSGGCVSNNVNVIGVNDGSSATCGTSAIYVSPLELIGTMFIVAVTNQSCPGGVGAFLVNQTASTQVSTTRSLSALRVAAVTRITNPTPQVLFSDTAIEDCVLGFSQIVTTFNPSACTTDPPDSGGGGGGCAQLLGSDGGPAPLQTCGDTSPIIIDTEGEGFRLTAAYNGVLFDIQGDGHPVQIGWTAQRSRNAFLALPGPDGLVHSGKDLFGNFTPQPASSAANGFRALAEWDKPQNGGNGDGVIDEHDEVFSHLRLWIDSNHDGVSQPEELHPLQELGIYTLSLTYFESGKTDEFGNQFRYKGMVNPGSRRDSRDEASEAGRWAYDVFLKTL